MMAIPPLPKDNRRFPTEDLAVPFVPLVDPLPGETRREWQDRQWRYVERKRWRRELEALCAR